jgi:hypothetical protein
MATATSGARRRTRAAPVQVSNELAEREVKSKIAANESAALFFQARSRWFRWFMDERGREIEKDCGHPTGPLLAATMKEMYEKDGVAQRVVDFLPMESWAYDPDVYDSLTGDTPFDREFPDFADRLNLYGELERADCQSRIGCYGGVLLGFDDSDDLERPVKGTEKGVGRPAQTPPDLLYMRPLDETFVQIAEMEADPSDPRYGQPTKYRITMVDPTEDPNSGFATDGGLFTVHWTRFLHIADNTRSNRVFGMPAMQPVYNRILDIRKLLGGSAEMYWKGALPGFSFEAPPELAAQIELDREEIRTEIDRYDRGLQRYLALVGVTAKSLAPQVASPKDQLMAQYQAIALHVGCPLRTWMGSEEGKLAATQDSRAWGKRVARRQKRHNTPNLIRAFTDRMILVKRLPAYKNFNAEWPDLHTPTSDDKANIARKIAAALKDFVVGGCGVIMDPVDFFMEALNVTEERAKEIVRKAGLNKIATVPTGSTGLGGPSGGAAGAGGN